jgi:hypothetical protein
MTAYRAIRADYDRETIVVYQAYNDAIADAAIKAQRFVAPFSMQRMTWIKPSFLWLMERSGWSTKSDQQRTLAVRITRTGWERALSLAELTSFDGDLHPSPDVWRTRFAQAPVHVQWDPERSIHGGKLEHRSIQVGLSRGVIDEYVNEWTTEIKDLTPLVSKLRQLRKDVHPAAAKKLLPPERIYPIGATTGQRLGVNL